MANFRYFFHFLFSFKKCFVSHAFVTVFRHVQPALASAFPVRPLMFYYISIWLFFTRLFVIFMQKKKYRTIFFFCNTSSFIFRGQRTQVRACTKLFRFTLSKLLF